MFAFRASHKRLAGGLAYAFQIRSAPDVKSESVPKYQRNTPIRPLDETSFTVKPRKSVPHEFVLDALAALSPRTRPTFGCLAVYVGERIVLALRYKCDKTSDNGVWLATNKEHHESLRGEFPKMRSIQLLGKEVTGWQVLPSDAPDFEKASLRACELIAARDPPDWQSARSTPPFAVEN